MRLRQDYGQFETERRAFSHFRCDPNRSPHAGYQPFTYREAQSGSRLELVYLHESFEDASQLFLGYPATCIGYVKLQAYRKQGFIAEVDFPLEYVVSR